MTSQSSWTMRALDKVERVGNKLPDPAIIFAFCLFVVWILSALLSNFTFSGPNN